MLRKLRDDRSLLIKSFWADALCVDRKNIEEKNYRVRLTADITLRAQLTIGWPDVEISQSTADFLRYLSFYGRQVRRSHTKSSGVLGLVQNDDVITAKELDRYEAAYWVVLDKMSAVITTKAKRHWWAPFMWLRRSSSSVTAQQPLRFDEKDSFAELCKLVDSHYFSRMWILPDIVLSSRLLLRCGSVQLDWDVLSNALRAMIMYGTHAELKAVQVENLLVADLLQNRYRRNQLSFSESLLAVRSCTFAVTIPQDYVHALLSLHKPGPDKVEYSRNPQDLYRRVTDILGDTFHAAIFLALSGLQDNSDRDNASSWVPQFDIRRQRMLLAHPNCHFLASAAIYDNLTEVLRLLKCQGCFVDEVAVVKSYLPPRRMCDQYSVAGDNLFEFFRWYQFASGSQSAPSADVSDAVLVPFAETIQAKGCNHVWESAAPKSPAETARCVRAFLQYLMDPDVLETNEIRLFSAACLPSYDRRFGRTTKSRLCLLPPEAKTGDLVCLIRGSRVPILLRKTGFNYENVGECYVHGIMYGQLDGMDEEAIFLE
ncbi:hypothetical protein LTS10_009654 [Elasticomyces elasticus]|nr:hypothetical protein LTS10_009654 [Elasticomyces elasticus]